MARHISYNIFRVLQDLDDGVLRHTIWMKNVHRALVCDAGSINGDDIDVDAHHRCEFGKWYDHVEQPELLNEPSFARIGELHHAMHDATAMLLRQRQTGGDAAIADYDRFINGAIDFKMEVRRLQFKLMKEVCAVDHLTGAWNRQTMYYKLDEEYERFIRARTPCCVAMVDLDYFKTVNDTYGHPVGDQVLQGVCTLFKSSLRRYDTIFRYGGEEFLICLPNSSIKQTAGMLERLRTALESTPFAMGDGTTVNITASFGIAKMDNEKSLDELIEQADRALLCAKAEGRNRVCIWNS